MKRGEWNCSQSEIRAIFLVLNYFISFYFPFNEPRRSTFYLHLIFLRDINWNATISLLYTSSISYSLKYSPELTENTRFATLNYHLRIHLKFPPLDDLLKIPKEKKKNIQLKLFPTNFASEKKLNPKFSSRLKILSFTDQFIDHRNSLLAKDHDDCDICSIPPARNKRRGTV